MLVNGAAISELEKYRNNRDDGSGKPMTVGSPEKKTSGDPVGNTGPVTV